MGGKMIPISHSASQAFKDCKRLYYLRYIRKLRRKSYSSGAIDLGKLWHKALAQMYFTRTIDGIGKFIDSNAKSEKDSGATRSMLTGYLARWGEFPPVSLHECVHSVPIIDPSTGRHSTGFSQFLIIDMLALHEDNSIRLWEHKTAASVDNNYIEKLFSDPQIIGYYSALRYSGIDVKSVIYDVALKPKLKQKKNESAGDFADRVLNWHFRKESYHREEIFISDRAVAEWREDLWNVTRDIKECKKNDRWYRNAGRCFDYYRQCEFLPLCQNGTPAALINAEYETRESPTDRKAEKPIF
jgi:hypothetical protein